MMPTETKPDADPVLQTIAMPADANVNGDIFGGWVLGQMDLGGAVAAGQRARGRIATIAVESMKFIRPVKIGDVLIVYALVEHVGRTSLGVRIECWVMRNRIGDHEKVTEALFSYVALDESGRSKEVPPVATTEQ